MIKRKGVCDVCSTEFELDEGSFGIKIMEDHLGPSSKKWTITVSNCVEGCFEEDFSQVCGIACLYKAISEVVGKKTKESASDTDRGTASRGHGKTHEYLQRRACSDATCPE